MLGNELPRKEKNRRLCLRIPKRFDLTESRPSHVKQWRNLKSVKRQ